MSGPVAGSSRQGRVSPFAIWVNLRMLLSTMFYNPRGSLKKFNLVVLWITLGNCVNVQISAAITETSIFVNILATMHYIISKMVSTHMFSRSKNVVL